MSLPLSELVATSEAVRATASRLEKRALMAALFARLESQGRLGVGWKAVSTALAAAAAPAPAPESNLPLFDDAAAAHTPATLAEVDRTFRALAGTSGAGSIKRTTAILTELFRRTDRAGREFLTALRVGPRVDVRLRSLSLLRCHLGRSPRPSRRSHPWSP